MYLVVGLGGSVRAINADETKQAQDSSGRIRWSRIRKAKSEELETEKVHTSEKKKEVESS